MSKTVKIDEMAAAISDALKEYEELTIEQTRNAVLNTAKKLAKDINARAKVTFGGTGKYAKSWRAKEKPEASTRLSPASIVYANKPGRSIGHLLEKGHAKRGGGREPGVPGRQHIEPATEAARETIITEIVKELSK